VGKLKPLLVAAAAADGENSGPKRGHFAPAGPGAGGWRPTGRRVAG